jgi:hypothetical protein
MDGHLTRLQRRWRRLNALLHHPDDLHFALQLGWFLWQAPSDMQASHLAELLDETASSPRPTAPSPQVSLERILRLSRPWLQLPWLRARNTCYLRALLLYRFLDSGDQPMQIVYAVETDPTPGARLRGHAWISVGGQPLGLEDATIPARSRPLYVHPQQPRHGPPTNG